MVKRSTINMNFLSVYDYSFINHFKQGDFFGPVGTQFATTTDPWNKNLDANGYPNHSNHDNHQWAAGVRIPSYDDFAGPYVLTWDGSGEVALETAGGWAIDAGLSSNYTPVSSARWHGTNSRIVASRTSGARELFSVKVYRTNRDGSGNFLKNLRFYRLEDETDFLAGKVYRSGWKQTLADLNPGAIRFMNWTGHNLSQAVRFEHRTLPSYVCYGSDGSNRAGSNWVASPKYPESTGVNAIAVASATGMPVAMQHGEVVTCRIGNATVRNGSKTVTAITIPGGVVTATAHGFQTGDVIIHTLTAGMTQLHNKPCTVTVSDANTYSLGISTAGYSAFTAGSAKQYITLNVGSRGNYPVLFGEGTAMASSFGDGYIAQYDYKTFVFDKDMVFNPAVTGAWTFNNNNPSNGHENVPPLEVCTALINELMAMTRSDGGAVGPIDMWVTLPHRGMLSVDPDYSAGSNWAKGMADVIINGANGYTGLHSSCTLIVEFSNETWNAAGGGAFDTRPYLRRQSEVRWASADEHSYTALRSAIMVNDIKAAFPAHPRIKFVICGQGTLGVSAGNSIRISGSALYDGDAWNTWGGDPMDHHDYFGVASYFDTSPAYKTANDATHAAAWVAAADAVTKEAACEPCVQGIKTDGGNETIDRYGVTLLAAYTAAMNVRGKKYIMYEGGWDGAVAGLPTADINNYKIAVKKSRAWATALRDFFDLYDVNPDALYPADYIMLNARWGHATPDLYLNGVEGEMLDMAWRFAALRNCGKRQWLVKT